MHQYVSMNHQAEIEGINCLQVRCESADKGGNRLAEMSGDAARLIFKSVMIVG